MSHMTFLLASKNLGMFKLVCYGTFTSQILCCEEIVLVIIGQFRFSGENEQLKSTGFSASHLPVPLLMQQL